jgi:hypothetical protein
VRVAADIKALGKTTICVKQSQIGVIDLAPETRADFVTTRAGQVSAESIGQIPFPGASVPQQTWNRCFAGADGESRLLHSRDPFERLGGAAI